MSDLLIVVQHGMVKRVVAEDAALVNVGSYVVVDYDAELWRKHGGKDIRISEDPNQRDVYLYRVEAKVVPAYGQKIGEELREKERKEKHGRPH